MNEMDDFMKDYNTMKISRSRDQSEMTSVGYIPSRNTSYGKKLTQYEERRDNKDYAHFTIEHLIMFFRENSAKAKVSYKSPWNKDKSSFSKLIETYTKQEIAEMILFIYTSDQKIQNKQRFMPCWLNQKIYTATQDWLKGIVNKLTREYREDPNKKYKGCVQKGHNWL